MRRLGHGKSISRRASGHQVQPIIDEAVYRPSSALPGAVPQFTTGVCQCECERAITRAETRRAGDLCLCACACVCVSVSCATPQSGDIVLATYNAAS